MRDELLERWVILRYRDPSLMDPPSEQLRELIAIAEPLYQDARKAGRKEFADIVDDHIRNLRLTLSGVEAAGDYIRGPHS